MGVLLVLPFHGQMFSSQTPEKDSNCNKRKEAIHVGICAK